MDKARTVANRLWSLFLPSIKAGNQIYFCFSRQLIRATLGDQFQGDAVEGFFSLASEFYSVSGSISSIDEAVFKEDDSKRSLAIIIIAQQVLVVEDMVSDGGISEDAYFPRLRRRISPLLGSGSLVPIPSVEFSRLWDTFKVEILKAGAKESSITFFKGLGNNIHRSFPMSQALLSSHDLIALFEKLPPEINLHKTSDEPLYNLIFKFRYSISSRARNALRVNWLRPRILNQVRNFSSVARAEIRELEEKVKRLQEIEVRIYSNDIFDDAFELRGVSPDGDYIEDSGTVNNAIQVRLDRAPCIFFALTTEKDYWTFLSTERDLNVGETLVIVTTHKAKAKTFSILKAYWPTLDDTLETIQLSESFTTLLVKIPVGQKEGLTVKDGQLVNHQVSESIVWHGGICVDQRTNKYLLGFPPDSLKINDVVMSSSEPIEIAGSTSSIGGFLVEMATLRQEHFVSIRIRGHELKVHFADKKNAYPVRFGNRFDGSTFSIVPEEVNDDDIFLRGFAFNAANFNRKTIKRSDVFKILDHGGCSWTSISQDQAKALGQILQECDLPMPVKRIAIQIISERMACPETLKNDLFEAA